MNRLRFLEMPGSTNVVVPRSHNYHGLPQSELFNVYT